MRTLLILVVLLVGCEVEVADVPPPDNEHTWCRSTPHGRWFQARENGTCYAVDEFKSRD